MTGKSTLLKITSVLLIVFGAMAVLMNGIALAGMNVLNQWALAMACRWECISFHCWLPRWSWRPESWALHGSRAVF